MLSAIYPARRFSLEYAICFKIFYLTICGYGLIRLWKINSQRQSVCFFGCLFCWGIILLCSILFSHYKVRAGSEIDIMFASIWVSFLFWEANSEDLWKGLRFLGIIIVLFLHFKLCLFNGRIYLENENALLFACK